MVFEDIGCEVVDGIHVGKVADRWPGRVYTAVTRAAQILGVCILYAGAWYLNRKKCVPLYMHWAEYQWGSHVNPELWVSPFSFLDVWKVCGAVMIISSFWSTTALWSYLKVCCRGARILQKFSSNLRVRGAREVIIIGRRLSKFSRPGFVRLLWLARVFRLWSPYAMPVLSGGRCLLEKSKNCVSFCVDIQDGLK